MLSFIYSLSEGLVCDVALKIKKLKQKATVIWRRQHRMKALFLCFAVGKLFSHSFSPPHRKEIETPI